MFSRLFPLQQLLGTSYFLFATRQSVAIAVNACLLMFNLEGACAGFPTTNGQSFADLDFLGI